MNDSYYSKNRETILKKQAEYRAANRDKIREYKRKQYAKRSQKVGNTSIKVAERQRQMLIEDGIGLQPDDPRWKNAEVHIVHHRPKQDYTTQPPFDAGKALEVMRRDKQRLAEILNQRKAEEEAKKKDAFTSKDTI